MWLTDEWWFRQYIDALAAVHLLHCMEKLYTTLCPDKNWTPKEIVIIQQNREILAIQTTEQINKKMQFL